MTGLREAGVGLSTEHTLLVDCVRAAFGLGDSPKNEAPVNWDLVLELAVRQGLTPLLYPGLTAMGLRVPGAVRWKLRAHHLAATVMVETQLEPLLRRVVGGLTARGLEPIVLKGGALAYLAYPSPVQRTMGDIDLLAPVDRIGPAAAALAELGLRMKDPELHIRRLPGHHHLPPYCVDNSPLTVELHHRLLAEPPPNVIDLPGIWARSRVENIAGVAARVLAPPDALLHTCVHLAASHRYRFYPLRGLVDILAITTRWGEELDWEFFLELTRRSRTVAAVYWPLRLSRLWLEANVPELVLSRLAPPGPMRKLVAAVVEPLILDNQAPAGAGSDILADAVVALSVHSGCSVRQQASGVLRSLFPPLQYSDHLATPNLRSRARNAAYLVSPLRLIRGLAALGRLLMRAGRAQSA
jgi:hypothetical protein